MIAEKLQEILTDVKEIKSEVDLQKQELEALLSEDVSESEQSIEQSPNQLLEKSETQNILDQLEEPTNISTLSGIQKSRAIQQKIELQNIKGQSLAMTIPEIADRAVFRSVFQILFQAQRVKEQLDLAVLSDLYDELVIGMESARLSSEQKTIISALSVQVEELKLEMTKPVTEQSVEKIKDFEKSLDEKIETINQWVEPYFGIFEN